MTLGERLRQLRGDRTLNEVAALCGLSVAYLSDMERNRTVPSLAMLRRLATGYGVSVLALLSGVDGMGAAADEPLPFDEIGG